MKNATQNVSFAGCDSGTHEVDHPVGFGIVRLLHAAVNEQTGNPSQIHNWRDCGWSFHVQESSDSAVEVALTDLNGENSWMAIVSPLKRTNWIDRLLGNRGEDLTDDIFNIAVTIDQVLRLNGFKDICWRLDGQPFPGQDEPHPIGAE